MNEELTGTATALLASGRTWRDAYWNLCGMLLLHPLLSLGAMCRVSWMPHRPGVRVRLIRVERWR